MSNLSEKQVDSLSHLDSIEKDLYTGITNDLERRLEAHQNQKGRARFFRISNPKNVLRTEEFPNRSEASNFVLKWEFLFL